MQDPARRDEASAGCAQLLEAIQDCREAMLSLRNALTRRGMQCAGPAVVLSGRPVRAHDASGRLVEEHRGELIVALQVEPPGARGLELSVAVAWSDDGWLVTADIEIEGPAGWTNLKAVHRRRASTLPECLAALREAVAALGREETGEALR